MTINRSMTNICSENLEESKVFYKTLFDFTIAFDSDWFVQLVSKENQLELGLVDRKHEIVPEDFQKAPAGFYITFVLEDVSPIFEKAKEANYQIVKEPHDTFYGQRRLLLKDPDGTLIDVSAPIKNFQF
ncbi:MAG: VOC family protein [Bacteroidota bacterium]